MLDASQPPTVVIIVKVTHNTQTHHTRLKVRPPMNIPTSASHDTLFGQPADTAADTTANIAAADPWTTNNERCLSVFWLVVLALPAAAYGLSCLLNATGLLGTASGWAAILLATGTAGYFATRITFSAPAALMEQSFPFFVFSYLLSIVGQWRGGWALTALATPVLAYLMVYKSLTVHTLAQGQAN